MIKVLIFFFFEHHFLVVQVLNQMSNQTECLTFMKLVLTLVELSFYITF